MYLDSTKKNVTIILPFCNQYFTNMVKEHKSMVISEVILFI